jgi:multiple sugar transport system permease protein
MALQNNTNHRQSSSLTKNNAKIAYGMMLPALTIIGIVVVVPSIMSLVNSFYSWNLFKPDQKKFSFLLNYQKILKDQTFWSAMRFTFGFIVLTMTLELVLGMSTALVVNRMPSTNRKLITTLLLIPYLLSPLTVGLIWKLLFTYDGLINWMLSFFGVQAITWMTGAVSAFSASVVAEVWRSYPFGFLLLLSAMSAFPIEPYEAAIVDGATKLQVFRFLTLPFCKPTLVIILIYQIVLKLRVFDLVYLLTGGGPVDYTTPLGLLIYRYYFRYYEAGFGSAAAVVVLICSIAVSTIVIANMQKEN